MTSIVEFSVLCTMYLAIKSFLFISKTQGNAKLFLATVFESLDVIIALIFSTVR